MSLAAYLAKNYLTADPSTDSNRPKKKRKKNHSSEPAAGLVIADDDSDLNLSHNSNNLLNDDDQDGPLLYNSETGRSAEFRKKKSSGWKSVGKPDSRTNESIDTGAEEADSILREAAQEDESRRIAFEEGDAPTVVGTVIEDDKRPRMEGGARGGLQTAEQTRALEAARVAQEEASLSKSARKKKTKEEREAQQEETVYRDATGRRIDIHLKRAEARKAEEAARRKEQEEKEKQLGDVQLAEREKRKKDLEGAKFLSVARYEDDEDLNQELKSRERWGDTMAGYTEKSGTGGSATAGASVVGSRTSDKPLYKGSFPPNRYGIRPGHRWDGVDRANGFEKEWFQARSRQERNRDLEYQWQMDE